MDTGFLVTIATMSELYLIVITQILKLTDKYAKINVRSYPLLTNRWADCMENLCLKNGFNVKMLSFAQSIKSALCIMFVIKSLILKYFFFRIISTFSSS